MAEAVKKIVVSNEGDKKGLDLAKKEGEALGKTLEHLLKDVVDDGQQKQSGEYLIACAVENAEGLYEYQNGEFQWQEPEISNVHMEVCVRDAADGRFIPGLNVMATLIDEDGELIGEHQLPLLWHPYIYHYGRNWKIPKSGKYTVQVRFDPPKFSRHDKKNGKRFTQPGEATFKNMHLKTGRQ